MVLCSASSNFNHFSEYHTLVVFLFSLSPEPPVIEGEECGVETLVGQLEGEAVLPCPSRAIPAGITVWTREGGEVAGPSERNGELRIAPLALEDSGLYTCTVSNVILEQQYNDSYTLRLLVQGE